MMLRGAVQEGVRGGRRAAQRAAEAGKRGRATLEEVVDVARSEPGARDRSNRKHYAVGAATVFTLIYLSDSKFRDRVNANAKSAAASARGAVDQGLAAAKERAGKVEGPRGERLVGLVDRAASGWGTVTNRFDALLARSRAAGQHAADVKATATGDQRTE